jgi:hypothetical protein
MAAGEGHGEPQGSQEREDRAATHGRPETNAGDGDVQQSWLRFEGLRPGRLLVEAERARPLSMQGGRHTS